MVKLQPINRTDVRSYDISELYQFADETGILERHRQMLSQPFEEHQVERHSLLMCIILHYRFSGGHEDHVL